MGACQSKVQSELWDEFKEAYSNNADSVAFSGLIDCGSQINAPDVSLVEEALLTSAGYQAHLDQADHSAHEPGLAPLLQHHGLWQQRHTSPEAQNAFDKQYGLALR